MEPYFYRFRNGIRAISTRVDFWVHTAISCYTEQVCCCSVKTELRDTDFFRPVLCIESIANHKVFQTEVITILDKVADRISRTVRIVIIHFRFCVIGYISRLSPDCFINIGRVIPETHIRHGCFHTVINFVATGKLEEECGIPAFPAKVVCPSTIVRRFGITHDMWVPVVNIQCFTCGPVIN